MLDKKNRKHIKRCKSCASEIGEYDIFCKKCGEDAKIIKKYFSAKINIKESWEIFKEIKSSFYSLSIFYILGILLPLSIVVFFTYDNYWLLNFSMMLVFPFAMIPFSFEDKILNGSAKIKDYFINLKFYPKFFGFTFVNIFYFFILKLICTGEPFFIVANDPILHLVRSVMIFYWIAIILPVPSLIIRNNVNFLKAFYIAYKVAETRWQQYFISMFLLLINFIGLLIAGLGLVVTIPFSFFLLSYYEKKLYDCKQFEKYLK